jgi:lipopolysaccharide export system protein LptC
MAIGPGLYSRVVAILKVGLPLVALGMLSALFLIQTDDRLGPGIRFTEGDMDALGSGLRISNPTFTGTTRGEDSFSFTAELVVPDAAPPTRASITAPTGELALSGGPVVALRAATGELDIEAQELALAGEVRIETSDGFEIAAERVTLDLRAGRLEAGGEGGVATEGPLGRIDSGTLGIAPAGPEAAGEPRRFSFGGGVRVLYDPPPESE